MAAQTPAAGDTWLVNDVTGTIEHVTSGPEAVLLEGTGWKAFPTQAAARAYAGESAAERVAGDAASPVTAAGDAIASASPIAGLFQSSLWLRVAEVAMGLILVGIGLNALLKGKPLQVVTGAAGVAGKAAML